MVATMKGFACCNPSPELSTLYELAHVFPLVPFEVGINNTSLYMKNLRFS